MSYYQGDFYGNGGYYRGDPFLGGLLSFGKKIIGGVGKLLGGGSTTKIITMPGGAPIGARALPAIKAVVQRGMQTGVGRAIIKHPVVSAAAAAGALGGASGAILGRAGRAPAMMQLPDGSVVRMRHRKRMNVCNPRALRRAIRRTHGFAKLAMRTIHLVHPKKKAHFGGFRKRRAKK
jgi:hypothetical protein